MKSQKVVSQNKFHVKQHQTKFRICFLRGTRSLKGFQGYRRGGCLLITRQLTQPRQKPPLKIENLIPCFLISLIYSKQL